MLFIQLLFVSFILASLVNVRDDKALGDTFTLEKNTFKLSKKDGKLVASIKLDSDAVMIGVSPDYKERTLKFTPYEKSEEGVEWNHDFVAIAVAKGGSLGLGIMTTALNSDKLKEEAQKNFSNYILKEEANKNFAKNAKPDFMKKAMSKLDEHSGLKMVVKKFEIARIDKDDSNKENQK